MTPHLTDAELRDFAGGAFGADEVLRVDEHMSACERCRTRASALTDASDRMGALHATLSGALSNHLCDEEVQQFVDGRLTDDARLAAVDHLAACSTCARQVAELIAWAQPQGTREAAVAPRRRSRIAWLAVAAALIVVALIPAVVTRFARSVRPADSASLAGLESLPATEQARVRRLLDGAAVSLPPFMRDVAPEREVLMGPPAAPTDTVDLVAPVATGTVSDKPTFEWRALAGADAYVVTVFDEAALVVARSAAVAHTSWVPSDALPRDRTFVWQVTARRGRDSMTFPLAPAPPAKFHVVDARTAEMLARAEAEHPESHLLLGLLAANAGVRDNARRHLSQVPLVDPRADVVRRVVDQLQTR